MNNKGSIVIITILLILVLLTGFLVYKFMGKYNAVPSSQSGSSKILPKQDSAMKASPAATVDADLNNLDQTISNLDTDLKSVDDSVNDKMGDLSEQ